MKRTLIVAALLPCLASSASAMALWQGDLFITAVNNAAACKAVGLNVGDFARGVFRARGVSDNGGTDLLSWHFGRSSGQLMPSAPTATTLNGATKATIRIIYGSAGYQQFAGAQASTIAATVTNPVTAGTAVVDITLTITNAYSKNPSTPSGCIATFKGSLAKRPGS